MELGIPHQNSTVAIFVKKLLGKWCRILRGQLVLKSFKQLNRLGKNNGRGEEGGFIKKRGLLNIKVIVNTK